MCPFQGVGTAGLDRDLKLAPPDAASEADSGIFPSDFPDEFASAFADEFADEFADDFPEDELAGGFALRSVEDWRGEEDAGHASDALEAEDHGLRDRIRATFLMAFVLRRWLGAVNRSRAAASLASQLRGHALHPLRFAFAALRRHAKSAHGQPRAVPEPPPRPPAPPRGTPALPPRAPASACAAHGKPAKVKQVRVVAAPGVDSGGIRLLEMLLRAPVGRALAGAMGVWRAQVRWARLEDESGDLELSAELRLQRGLRVLEVERRVRAERERGKERLALILARVLAKRQAAFVALAFSSLATCSLTMEVVRLRSSLRDEIAEREALAAEIQHLNESDAEVSAELTRTVTLAEHRVQQTCWAAASAHLRHSIRRQMVTALHRLRTQAVARSQARRIRASSLGSLPLASVVRRRYRVAWARLRQVLAEDAACNTSSYVATPTSDRRPSRRSREPSCSVERAVRALPSSSSQERLGLRADALLRLKVRLGLRQDFADRVWSVPATPTRALDVRGADSAVLEALAHRLARGAASLLEYVLASALRSRLRAGLNSLLEEASSSQAAARHRRRPSSPMLRGRPFGVTSRPGSPIRALSSGGASARGRQPQAREAAASLAGLAGHLRTAAGQAPVLDASRRGEERRWR